MNAVFFLSVIGILSGVLVINLLLFRRRNNTTKQDAEVRLDQISRSLFSLVEQINSRLRDAATVAERGQQRTNDALGKVSEQFGEQRVLLERVGEFQREIKKFQELLQPPKARGGIGERLLEHILTDMMPEGKETGMFERQLLFQNGERVDFAIHLKDLIIPIDVKFPKEAYERIRDASGDEERDRARSDFRRAVRQHIDAVAKYIRPEEKTSDFAFLYFPFEGLYLAFSEDSLLVDYAMDKRVIVVSPGTFFAYLRTVLLGLKNFAVEKSAKEILASLGKTEREFSLFAERFRVTGSHLRNAMRAYEESERQLSDLAHTLTRWQQNG